MASETASRKPTIDEVARRLSDENPDICTSSAKKNELEQCFKAYVYIAVIDRDLGNLPNWPQIKQGGSMFTQDKETQELFDAKAKAEGRLTLKELAQADADGRVPLEMLMSLSNQ